MRFLCTARPTLTEQSVKFFVTLLAKPILQLNFSSTYNIKPSLPIIIYDQFSVGLRKTPHNRTSQTRKNWGRISRQHNSVAQYQSQSVCVEMKRFLWKVAKKTRKQNVKFSCSKHCAQRMPGYCCLPKIYLIKMLHNISP